MATPGAGIGLFVCRQLVAAMGGRMWARPLAEGGAEFGLTLPLYVDANDRVEPVATPTDVTGAARAV